MFREISTVYYEPNGLIFLIKEEITMSEKKTEKVSKKEGMINWLKDHKVEVAAVAVAGAEILYAVI